MRRLSHRYVSVGDSAWREAYRLMSSIVHHTLRAQIMIECARLTSLPPQADDGRTSETYLSDASRVAAVPAEA